MANLLPHIALGNRTYSGNARSYMENKNKPLWDDFNSLIWQAVRYQKAARYIDLNKEMRWALGIAVLRENKALAIDAEFGNLNVFIAKILETKGSFESLRKLYEHLVGALIEPPPPYPLHNAHVAYCINGALEEEEDKQAFYSANEEEKKGGFHAEDKSF
jgi:predicted ATPase